MEGNSPYITNLVNSIIGVSVLAMPFCLKQCGIILGLGLLFCAAWLTYLSCSMLAQSAYHKRRRTYEYLGTLAYSVCGLWDYGWLEPKCTGFMTWCVITGIMTSFPCLAAFYTLGPTGKFTVELSMIGMMLGTCVAFYVVIGDLSNGILSKFIDGTDPPTLRTFTIVFCALFIALPLGMMKSLDVLSYFGFFSLLFYLVFLVVVIYNAVRNGFLQWDWWGEVTLFRLSGVFQCLPIFSLAYACQCQLFIVYNSLEDPSVRRIEDIVSGAIKFVTVVYMLVGFFGYATYREHISGNLLVSFPSNHLLDLIKLGFAMSIVLGFPLMISPCRQSIHTLFFAKPAGEGLQPNTHIPPCLFKSITLTIVLSTMTIAIVIPNVETILGLTGATMGSIICFIFPALIYEKAAPKGPGAIPKFVFCLGCILLVVCTYSNLANTGQSTEVFVDSEVPVPKMSDIGIGETDKEPGNIEIENKEEGKMKEPDDSEDKDKPKGDDVNDQEDNANAAVPVRDPHKDPGNEESPKEDVQVPLPDPKEEENNPTLLDHKEESKIYAEHPGPQIPSNPEQDQVVAKDSPVEEHEVVDPARRVPEDHQGEPKLPADGVPQHPPADRISPKIIKKDEVHPMQEIPPPDPGAQIGERSQKLDGVKSPVQKDVPNADVVPPVKTSKQEQKREVDDSPEEKELLEKIKIQHDKQQQLLKEQEQLIKKLVEHQDKKEEAVDEKRDGDAGDESYVEAQAERDDQSPVLGKSAGDEKSVVDAPVAPGNVMRDVDAKVNVPGANVLARDGILQGRELLSEQNGGDVTVGEEVEVQKPGDAALESVDRLAPHEKNYVLGNFQAKAAPVQVDTASRERKTTENLPIQSDADPQLGQLKKDDVEIESNLIKDTFDVNQGRARRKERALEDDETMMKDKDSPGGIIKQTDLEPEKVFEFKEEQGILTEEGIKLKKMDDGVQEEKVEDSNLIQETEKEESLAKESLSDLVNLKENEVGVVKNREQGKEDEEKDSVVECLEDDLNCWQGKSKSRELKSFGDNNL